MTSWMRSASSPSVLRAPSRAPSGGTNNDGNAATATAGGTAQAGVGFGTGNDGNTAIATDFGTANAAVDTDNIVGATAIAGAGQTVNCPPAGPGCVP